MENIQNNVSYVLFIIEQWVVRAQHAYIESFVSVENLGNKNKVDTINKNNTKKKQKRKENHTNENFNNMNKKS